MFRDRSRWDGVEWLVLVSLACSVTSQTLLRPTATYRALELGAGVLGVSLVVAASSVLAIIGAVPIGRWIDRSGERRATALGGVLLVAAAVGGALSSNLVVLVLSMTAVGLGHVAVVLAAQSVAAHARSLEHRQQRFARNGVSASIGQIIGPALAGSAIALAWPAELYPTTMAFVIGGLLSLVTVGLARRMPVTEPQPKESSDGPLSVAMLGQVVGQPGMPAALSSGIAILIALDVLMAFLPLIGEAAGLSAAVVGGLLSLRGASSLVSRLVMGSMIRRLGTRSVLTGTMICSAAAIAGVAWTTEVWQLAVLMVIFGFGVGVGAPMTASWVAQLAPATLRGTALGLRLSGNRLGQVLAPLGLGALAAATGIGVGAVLLAPALALILGAGWVVRAQLGDGD